jgi:hypothetical protein
MNRQNRIIFVLALALIGGAALGLHHLKAGQRLGAPGIKTSPIARSPLLNIYLPEFVLDYNSIALPTDKAAEVILPKDTSFGQRGYTSTLTSNQLVLDVVLMGADRTSIHKPQFCLTGQGWNIDPGRSSLDTVRVESPHPYDLQVMRLVSSRDFEENGRRFTRSGIYVYWFVADHALTADHWTRMRQMATHLLSTGELQRWAYVSCFAVCQPGNETATYAKMKEFIAAAVPQFQLAANPPVAGLPPEQTAALVH